MQNFADSIQRSSEYLRDNFSQSVDTIIVLGSGLSNLSLDGYVLEKAIDYKSVPGLPEATAPSHIGELRLYKGQTKNGEVKKVVICAGRFHLYEGYSAKQVSALVYILSQLGASELIITNAAGALNSDYRPGEVMLIEDHINFTGQNPLIGQDDRFGMRFPDMSEAYSNNLLASAASVASEQKIKYHKGVYAGVTGPSLETSAERRMLRSFGADAVGMSTVVEVIAAKHCSMDVLGLSAITNLALGDSDQQPDTIEEVLHNAEIAGRLIGRIIEGVLV